MQFNYFVGQRVEPEAVFRLTVYLIGHRFIAVYVDCIVNNLERYGSALRVGIIYRIPFDAHQRHFWFHSLADEVIKLHKSENAEDSLVFTSREVEVISTTPEVIKKDSIVTYKNTRYRGYVYINPSKMKVFKTSYSENGISVDNVYYDNVIHICVYEGKKMLFGQDITKKMFADIFPAEMLDQAILADMNFMGVDSKGYHYQATLGIPESSVYNLVNMIIGFDNTMNIEKAE